MQSLLLFLQDQWQGHWELIGLFVIALLLLGLVEFMLKQYKEKLLSPAQVTQMLNHEQAVVIDLRPEEMYAKGHIVGSCSLPYRGNVAQTIQAHSNKLKKLKLRPLVLVCAKGLISEKLVGDLKQQGFSVYVLGGGMGAWLDAGMPIVTH